MSNPISENCSSGLHDYCTLCECKCHGIIPDKETIKQIYDLLKNQYISYEDYPLIIEFIRKIHNAIPR